MIHNLPVRSIEHRGLTIEGYSRAAVQSYWRVRELKLGFDLGAHPFDFAGTPTWFVSHCHLDHMASLPVYVARRRMMGMTPPRIFLPQQVVADVTQLLAAWEKLDGGRMDCELIGLSPGEEVVLSRDHAVTAFATRHTVPSLGFLVWLRTRKLKCEFQGLSSREVRTLCIRGASVSEETRIPLVCYVGDTAPRGLDEYPPLYEARVLITEITFVDPHHSRDRIHKHGHIHLDDFVLRADRFRNELIIASHLTARTPSHKAKRIIEQRIPESLKQRLHLWT